MHYSIEMFFDAPTHDRIDGILKGMLERNSGLYMRDQNAKPHITIGNWNDIDIDGFISKLSVCLFGRSKLNLNLSSIGIFAGSSNTVFLQPVVTRDLLDFHCVLHNLFQNENHIGWEYYLPGTWVPHCALDISTNADDILTSTDFITRRFTPFWGCIDKLCLYQCSRPEKQILATLLLEN